MLGYSILLALISLSIDVFALKEGECPPVDNIPCTCAVHTAPGFAVGHVYVECHAPSVSGSELKSMLGTFKGYKLGGLSIINMTIASYDETTLEGLNVDMLTVEGVSVTEEVFQTNVKQLHGLENSLRLLTVRNSYHTGVPLQHLQLDHMLQLDSVMLHENKILEVGNDWFANGPKRLNTLLLDRNDIQHMGDSAFHALENLSVLWIKGSNLKEIKRSMLPSPASKLHILDISSNRLTELPTDLFSNMPNLGIVALENNLLKTLPQSIFPKAVTLFIDENPLHCDEDLKWICQTSTEVEETVCASPSQWDGSKMSDFCNA